MSFENIFGFLILIKILIEKFKLVIHFFLMLLWINIAYINKLSYNLNERTKIIIHILSIFILYFFCPLFSYFQMTYNYFHLKIPN